MHILQQPEPSPQWKQGSWMAHFGIATLKASMKQTYQQGEVSRTRCIFDWGLPLTSALCSSDCNEAGSLQRAACARKRTKQGGCAALRACAGLLMMCQWCQSAAV